MNIIIKKHFLIYKDFKFKCSIGKNGIKLFSLKSGIKILLPRVLASSAQARPVLINNRPTKTAADAPLRLLALGALGPHGARGEARERRRRGARGREL